MNTQAPPPKHTPGPWITDSGKVPKLGHAIGVLKQSHKPGEKGESICIVALAKDAQPHDHANARLIAAAPDLLASLDMLSGLVPALCAEFGVTEDFTIEVKVKSTGETRQMLFSEVIQATMDALAKTTGKDQS